jgi:hypothetical protein
MLPARKALVKAYFFFFLKERGFTFPLINFLSPDTLTATALPDLSALYKILSHSAGGTAGVLFPQFIKRANTFESNG